MKIDCYYIRSTFINKLFSCYLLWKSDGSNSDSEMNIISEGKRDEVEHDRATVDTDSFERVRGQLGSNVAENAISWELSVIEMEFHKNIHVDVYYK